jgi:hypothetical protein
MSSADNQKPTQLNTTAPTNSLTQDLTSPSGPTSPHAEADAQRAISHVGSWKPQFDRRQSWDKEEHKHALQMSRVGDVETGPGFSERG